MEESPFRSRIVVISWWSNCLGLACLERLARFSPGRSIAVIQVGKSSRSKERFRRFLPAGVTELPYPVTEPGEHSRVIRRLVLGQLHSELGIWFVDHDLFLQKDWEPWLQAADMRFMQSGCCLCLPDLPTGAPAITNPAFWISPARWPEGLDGFDPVPYRPGPEARRPDLYRSRGELRLPAKDTLMEAREVLEKHGRVAFFSLAEDGSLDSDLPPFVPYIHLGGLYLFSGSLISNSMMPPRFNEWMRCTVRQFVDFYQSCPREWVEIEDRQLLLRIQEFEEALHV